MIGLGGGFGAGMSWVECKQTFAVNSAVKPQLSTFALPTLPPLNSASANTPGMTHTSTQTGAIPLPKTERSAT